LVAVALAKEAADKLKFKERRFVTADLSVPPLDFIGPESPKTFGDATTNALASCATLS
jgi:hypothetical protein